LFNAVAILNLLVFGVSANYVSSSDSLAIVRAGSPNSNMPIERVGAVFTFADLEARGNSEDLAKFWLHWPIVVLSATFNKTELFANSTINRAGRPRTREPVHGVGLLAGEHIATLDRRRSLFDTLVIRINDSVV
jgi:hypothetical protein